MDERDFLALAQALLAQPGEAAWRTAVSRAYFGAFHVGRRFMEGLGFTVPPTEQAHGHVWIRLANGGNAQVAQAGNDLHQLRRQRNRADYELGRPCAHTHALQQVQHAERIVGVLDAVAMGPDLLSIRDEMIRYERDVLGDVTWRP